MCLCVIFRLNSIIYLFYFHLTFDPHLLKILHKAAIESNEGLGLVVNEHLAYEAPSPIPLGYDQVNIQNNIHILLVCF